VSPWHRIGIVISGFGAGRVLIRPPSIMIDCVGKNQISKCPPIWMSSHSALEEPWSPPSLGFLAVGGVLRSTQSTPLCWNPVVAYTFARQPGGCVRRSHSPSCKMGRGVA